MGCSLCPHLVQEYFERVSDIVTTYRPQILKQVEYDRINENLVLRGAVRPEEHERISQYGDTEGQVSQMLVVIQNRMWGLENLIAVFMEEHISPWLTQEMFRAYNEHLVKPLKTQRDSRICQCVRISNSVLYKGWVQALKSLDSWILKTGTVLGFVNQTIYPTTDNMLAFLSDKLADYTGGDSQSCNRDDLVPFGFAPNSSGEVQVAELEEDDINDLISLSENLCIGYPSSMDGEGGEENASSLPSPGKILEEAVVASTPEDKRLAIMAKPVERKVNTTSSTRKISEGRSPTKPRRFSLETIPIAATDPNNEKQKQRDLIARLSAPKSAKNQGSTTLAATPSKSSPVRLRSIPNDRSKGSSPTSQTKPRPKSMELHRSVSIPSPMTSSTSSSTSSTSSFRSSRSPAKVERNTNTPVAGKTTGFVRPKTNVCTSPKARSKGVSITKPTAVAKPTPKSGQGKVRQNKSTESSTGKATENSSEKPQSIYEKHDNGVISNTQIATPPSEEAVVDKYEAIHDTDGDDDPFPEFSTEMSSLFLSKTILSEEEQTKNLGYYHLNFDNFQDV